MCAAEAMNDQGDKHVHYAPPGKVMLDGGTSPAYRWRVAADPAATC